jgi:hypothetical protein
LIVSVFVLRRFVFWFGELFISAKVISLSIRFLVEIRGSFRLVTRFRLNTRSLNLSLLNQCLLITFFTFNQICFNYIALLNSQFKSITSLFIKQYKQDKKAPWKKTNTALMIDTIKFKVQFSGSLCHTSSICVIPNKGNSRTAALTLFLQKTSNNSILNWVWILNRNANLIFSSSELLVSLSLVVRIRITFARQNMFI